MKVLVTGGAGFIGSHVCDALVNRGYSVRILDNLTEPVHKAKKPNYITEGAELVIGDVRIKADWARALDGVDAVYHLAAYQDYMTDFSKFFHVNTTGTAMLYEVAVEQKIPLKKVIVASSQAVYGEGKYKDNAGHVVYPDIRSRAQLEMAQWDLKMNGLPLDALWTDETQVNPQNQYAVSKYTQELVSLNLGKRYDIPTVCMRYSIVQGPRQSLSNAYSGACRIFALSYLQDKQPIIYEDGNQYRDFVNIEDVVRANLAVLDDERANFRCFNVGSGKKYSVLEFAEIAAKVFGKPFEPVISGEFRFGDTRHILSDISSLRELGWEPKNDCEYSVRTYRAWLTNQVVAENIVENAYKQMRLNNVLGKVSRK